MLSGIRIIEIEGLGPAPFGSMMFADLGAEVTVIHRQQPAAPGAPERSLLDRGKKSIVLDLKSESDLEVIRQLVADADGLIEGFRPGVMERLGLGPDVLMEKNSRLVYGRLTGWGQDGPQSSYAGHDLNFIAMGGALWYASKRLTNHSHHRRWSETSAAVRSTLWSECWPRYYALNVPAKAPSLTPQSWMDRPTR